MTRRATHDANRRGGSLPAQGTTIEKRDRHGAVRCKCTVEDGGIRYAGKVYTSLSGAAMAAAKDLDLKNKTQNGYIFWGLIKPPRPASDPLVALERAWERYRDRVETLVKEGVTEENRGKVAATPTPARTRRFTISHPNWLDRSERLRPKVVSKCRAHQEICGPGKTHGSDHLRFLLSG